MDTNITEYAKCFHAQSCVCTVVHVNVLHNFKIFILKSTYLSSRTIKRIKYKNDIFIN